jgi:lysine 6-dehydrogenase
MQVLCLGGAGKICSEAVLDLVAFADFERITIANLNQKAGADLAALINDERVDFARLTFGKKKSRWPLCA